MKKFLDILNETASQKAYDVVDDIEINNSFIEMRNRYRGMVGKRALYNCKSTKETRVVSIVEANKNFVRLVHRYYSATGYSGEIHTCVTYGALLCGDDELSDVS